MSTRVQGTKMRKTKGYLFSVFVLAAILLAACGRQGAPASPGSGSTYRSALPTNFKDALDVEGQLALGTLELEGTENQVTQDQAVALLPPWEALQANAARSTLERQAILEQIETTMTEAQIKAIAAMRLTQATAQTWIQDHAASSAAGRGGRGASSARTAAGGSAQSGSATGQQTTFPLQPVIQLLTARSGRSAARSPSVTVTITPTRRAAQTREAAPAPTLTPAPEPTGTPTQVVEPTATWTPVVTNTPSAAAVPTATWTLTVTSAPATPPPPPPPPSPMSTPVATAVIPAPTGTPLPTSTPSSAADPAPALVQVADTNPGPPFTIEISANRATRDPLVEQSDGYLVTGIVRNDSNETYIVNRINVTFYDANGFRGSFRRFPNRRSGGEWIWFGATQAEFACLLLAPGETCPFSVEITAQDMASFLVHPDAAPTGRESAPVTLSNLNMARDPSDYVRITGTATNANPFKVKNVITCGVLLDSSGEIVSMGSSYVLQEDIQPGASVQFDLRVPSKPYAEYQLYTQAERDWD
jgi:hypothetical protein